MATARLLAAREGRPSVLGLQASLTTARDANETLRGELRAAGQDMRSAGFAIQYADRVGRRDLTLHTAAQLVVRGERLARS